MEISIDKNYKITTVPLNFVLEKRVPESTNKKGETVPERWVQDGYFSDVRHLLKAYVKKTLLEDTTIRSFDELFGKLEELENIIRTTKRKLED